MIDACRTPIGKAGGSLTKYTETELMSIVMCAILDRNPKYPIIDEVIIGCCFPQEHRNLAKKAVFQATLPLNTPAVTVNRTCASSMEALVQGFYRIMNNDANNVLIGGTENMNRNPHVMKMNIQNVRKYIKQGLPLMPSDLSEEELLDSIGISVDMMARNKGISRNEQDEYAAFSHQRAEQAWLKGYFNTEVISIPGLDNNKYTIRDEGINTSIAKDDYKKANPLYFSDGSITKYNASSISDGAAVMLLSSEREVKEHNLQPIAEIISSSLVGGPLNEIGTVAADAYLQLLAKTKLKDSDINLIECNEAYAAQAIACMRKAEWNEQKVNINGGSLALGHPLGCTGLRICTTLIFAMNQKNSNYGVATMCAGGGMGQAVLFKRYERY